jgi:hypothetical protein
MKYNRNNKGGAKMKITAEEFEPVKRETRRFATEIRHSGYRQEREIRKSRKDLVKREVELNALFREHLKTEQTFNFIGYFLYGLPTLYGINELISGDDGEPYRI